MVAHGVSRGMSGADCTLARRATHLCLTRHNEKRADAQEPGG